MERCSMLRWVDVSDALLQRSDCIHVQWHLVLWCCFVRLDRQVIFAAVWSEEESSVVLRWSVVLVA
jgi:hypothetical protein